jgi:bifunctional non-homologous end joining protein LigD
VPIKFVVFDLLGRDGVDLTDRPYDERRREPVGLGLDGPAWTTCETFDDGWVLFEAVCRLGYEGVVAKSHASLYRPGERGWVKDQEPELLASGRRA